MYSDSMLDTPPGTGDALPPLPPQPVPKNAVVATLAMPVTLLLAIGGAFYTVSTEPMLADSAHAPSTAAVGCEALSDRAARQRCTPRLVAEPKVHDAGAAQLAALATRPRGARQ